MIKLALIGKNISHSKSQEIYESIFKKKITYSLIDVPDEENLPDLKALLKNYNGVSITAPYKKIITRFVDLDQSGFGIINSIKLHENKIIGTNTDAMGIKEILSDYLAVMPKGIKIAILGDGNTGQVLSMILDLYKIEYQVFSRRNKNLNVKDIKSFFSEFNSDVSRMIINCCSRVFTFKPEDKFFDIYWNLNYDQNDQEQEILKNKISYIDGRSLLLSQAKYAIKFWNI